MNKFYNVFKIQWGIMFLLFAMLLSACSSVENKLKLSGMIETKSIDISSEVSGKIINVLKDEGDEIKKGDILFEIDSSLQKIAVKQREAIVKIKEEKLRELINGARVEEIAQAEASAKALWWQLNKLKSGTRSEQISQAEAQVRSAEESVKLAEITYEYYKDKYYNLKKIGNKQIVPEMDLKDAKFAMDSSYQKLLISKENLNVAKYQLELLEKGSTQAAINIAKANYEQALAKLKLLKNGPPETAINQAKEDLNVAKAQLEQAKLVLSKYKVRSNMSGVYTVRYAGIGDVVNIGSKLATVTDLKDMEVKMYVPQKYIGMISLNEDIVLKSSALPGKDIKGRIIYISDKAEYTPKNVETNEAKENTVFKIKVKVLDNMDILRTGMTVDADITLSTGMAVENSKE